jgi:hypothetical protein
MSIPHALPIIVTKTSRKKGRILMAKNAQKDNSTILLTDKVRQVLEAGGAANIEIPLVEIHIGPSNPRKRKGFDPESMRELADSIAQDGLLKNLLLRQIPDPDNPTKKLFELVAGERRTRALLTLVEEDRVVFNQETGEHAPASEVYKVVRCLVQGKCDDRRAVRLAFIENDKQIPLSDADVIDLCATLETQGMSRKDQAELLGKSQAWLSHTHGFAQRLTPENYERLRSGEINRSVAQKLMDYEPEVQAPIIEAANTIATERHEATKEKVETELQEANTSLEEAFSEQVRLRRQNADPKRVEKAKQKVERAQKTVKKSPAAEAAGVRVQAGTVAERYC